MSLLALFGTDWMFDLLTAFMEWVKQKFADFGIDFTTFDLVEKFQTLWPYMAAANKVLPFQECFTILFAGFAARVVIRAGRWVLSAIPASNQ